MPTFEDRPVLNTLNELNFTQADVQKILQNLKPDKAWLRPGRGATSWPLTPRATSNNMRIQHISISKLDSHSSSKFFTCFIWWFHLKQIVVPTICGTMYCIMGHREWVPKFRVPKFRSSHASSEAPETSSFQVPKFPELQVPKFPEL